MLGLANILTTQAVDYEAFLAIGIYASTYFVSFYSNYKRLFMPFIHTSFRNRIELQIFVASHIKN